MGNKLNTVLYIGVTNSLGRRIAEHKAATNPGFATQYGCSKLLYFEYYDDMASAIAREKQLKNWKRAWKDELISTKNQSRTDLAEKWLGTENRADCGSSPQ